MSKTHQLKVTEEPDETETERDLFFNIINRFVGFYSRKATRKTQNDPACEYPFVAMDTRQVFEQVRFVKNYLNIADGPVLAANKKHNFLDVGCGIGNVLLVAEQFNFDVYGLEKDEYPAQVAARLIGEDQIFQKDIWTYNDYGKYDIIYYFRPFSDREPQRKFEKLIEDRMKVGAILIANHKNSDDISNDQRFMKLDSHLPIWKKTTNS